MNETKTVYLLPLFLKNMSFSLKFTTNSLCDKLISHITEELEEVHSEIESELKSVTPKKMDNEKIIQKLENQYKKVTSGKGGKQIEVLRLSRELLINLKHRKRLSISDIGRLKKIIDSDRLFFGSYDTGLELKTVERLLDVYKNKMNVNSIKMELLFEVFRENLNDQAKIELYLKLYCSDAAQVQSTFFTYMGKKATFVGEDSIIDAILNLRGLSYEEFFQELKNICSYLNLICQAELLKNFPDRQDDEDEKKAVFDNQLIEDSYYTDFHTTAMNFLKMEMSLCISELDERYALQALYSIVDDAWCVFSKMYHKDIMKGTSLIDLPFQELVIHSLHNNERFHRQLCNSFKKWQQEDSL